MSETNASIRQQRTCSVCGGPIRHAEVDEAGLCGPCGLRVRLRRLPAVGSACALCGERRRRNLTVWELTGEVVCHGCAFHLREMRPWPTRLDPIARRLRRERRADSRS
ncbi:MAG: hypothetical protein ABI333_09400 [bacterium]